MHPTQFEELNERRIKMLAELDRLYELIRKNLRPANKSLSDASKRALVKIFYDHGFLEGTVRQLGLSTLGDYPDSKKRLDELQIKYDNHRDGVLALIIAVPA